jgi:hypothetical protein
MFLISLAILSGECSYSSPLKRLSVMIISLSKFTQLQLTELGFKPKSDSRPIIFLLEGCPEVKTVSYRDEFLV